MTNGLFPSIDDMMTFDTIPDPKENTAKVSPFYISHPTGHAIKSNTLVIESNNSDRSN
jgi:hypothetical protein